MEESQLQVVTKCKTVDIKHHLIIYHISQLIYVHLCKRTIGFLLMSFFQFVRVCAFSEVTLTFALATSHQYTRHFGQAYNDRTRTHTIVNA